ncbi:protoheme IX farnesyltransferase, mitochondrial [Camellia sinensis]|uniref:protoheme IX farnesyltransferase, mitochondrial n=1 Tax=Camellia sinensis TaxID=4442 RepID=UPI001035816F|nr:protoheme IX farnesyltransferase, mitochondrial [Camellia sinensis]
MLRNSVSFSSKVLTSSNPNSKSTFLFPGISTTYYGIERSLSHSQFYSTTATSSSSSSPDSLKLGFPKLDPVRSSGFASSAAAIDASPLAAASVSRARDVVDLARHYGRCYWELSKARLSMLVVATSGTGYVLGSGNAIDYVGLCCTCAGTMMVAASANSLNQVFEINNDAKMKRTRQRPLPSGRITVPHAVSWASSVGAAGTALLACEANMLAAGLAASNLFLYAFVYTPLKQIHPVNTWVGAVVGAIPPLLGWVAASGQVTLNGMILPAALYFWQIPHFMALAYLCRDDYAAGGFRMFSLADASGRRTALVALRNCLYLIPLGYLACDWGITSGWFCLESTLLAFAISGTALSFYLNRTTKNARRMFHASLLYLPVFMSGMLLHRLPDNQQLLGEENSEGITIQLSSSETLVQEIEIANCEKKAKHSGVCAQAQPPVAYASVAPFPFLPAPTYAMP